jgi:hypothetical protein
MALYSHNGGRLMFPAQQSQDCDTNNALLSEPTSLPYQRFTRIEPSSLPKP